MTYQLSEYYLKRRALMRMGLLSALALPARLSVAADSNAAARPEISPVTLALANYVAQVADRALPADALEATKHHLLDTLAAMISGTHLLAGEKAIAYIKAQGGTPQASIPGTNILTTVVNASLAGGMLAHADETDDSHSASLTHPGAGVVPAALEIKRRIELIGDDELQKALPSRQAIVDIKLKDGRVLHSHTKNVRGTVANPMTRDEVGQKAYDLCVPIIGQDKARALVTAIWNLEQVANVQSLRDVLQP